MPKILAVNNYPTEERFARILASLDVAGSARGAINWNESGAARFNEFDGVVLSGSPDMMSMPRVHEKFAAEIQAIRESHVPILGICFGHQMMAHAFGSRVVEAKEPVLKFVKTEVIRPHPLFDGLKSPLSLLESRHEVVESLPEGFELLATSETTEVAGMKHKTRPLFGVQSHPERYTKDNPDGIDVIKNFVEFLR